MQAIGTKFCTKCKTDKPLDDFANCRTKRDGKFIHCKNCVNEYRRGLYVSNVAYRENTKAKTRQYYKEHYATDVDFTERRRSEGRKARRIRYATIPGRAWAIHSAAKKRDPNCTMTLEHVVSGIEAGFCPVTGIKFDLTDEHQKMSGRYRNPYSPSVDRIDPRLGYTNENTRIVITQYNIMKNDLADYELLFICQQVVRRAPC